MTSNWSAAGAWTTRGGGGAGEMTDLVASRQRVDHALHACGPATSAVSCAEEVERERKWPARSAKIVLQLALDRLARHDGVEKQARGDRHAHLRTWRRCFRVK